MSTPIKQYRLTNGSSTTDATSFATASISPTGGRLVLAWVINTKATTPDTPTISGGGMTTWTQVATVLYGTIASPTYRITLFRALQAVPGSATATIDFGGVTQTACIWVIQEFANVQVTGANGADALVQSATNVLNAGDFTIPIALAAAANNDNGIAVGWGVATNNTGLNVTSNRTYGYEYITGGTQITPSVSGSIYWRDEFFDPTPTWGLTFSGFARAGIAVELALQVAADPPDPAAATSLEVTLLSDNGLFLDLVDPAIYGVGEQHSISQPVANLIFAPIFGGYQDPLVGVDYANRQADFALHIRGDTYAEWSDAYRDVIRALLDTQDYWAPTISRPGARAYLRVRQVGQVEAMEYDVLASPGLSAGTIREFFWPDNYTPNVPLNLVLSPWGRTQGLTKQYSGIWGTQDWFIQPDPLGDYPTRSRVTIQNLGGGHMTGSGNLNIRRGFLGKKSGIDPTKLITNFSLVAGTYTGYVVSYPTNSITEAFVEHGLWPTARYLSVTTAGAVTNDNMVKVSINANLKDFVGSYRVICNMVSAGSPSLGPNLRLTYGGDAGTAISNDLVTIATNGQAFDDGLFDLGPMYIPHIFQPDNIPITEFNFGIQITTTGSVSATRFAGVYLIPIDEGYVDFEASADLPRLDRIVIDDLGKSLAYYVVDNNGLMQQDLISFANYRSFTLLPGVENIWYFVSAYDKYTGLTPNSFGGLPTAIRSLTLDYYPLFSLSNT
jgi:hypothetical protein